MSLFKRLFGQKVPAVGSDSHTPDRERERERICSRKRDGISVTPVAVPRWKEDRVAVGPFELEEQLGKLSQARPQREGLLWQGMDKGCPKFFAFVKSGEENKKWLLDRLGGENALGGIEWDLMQSSKLLLGMSRQLLCLKFDFTLDSRYRLLRRLHTDDAEEIWSARDEERKKDVLCTIVKPGPKCKIPEHFSAREYAGEGRLFGEDCPGLLETVAEGVCKIQGPFSLYLYKYTRLLYVVSESTVPPVPASLFLSRQRRLHLEEAIGVLYQGAQILSFLHERGWIHGRVAPQRLMIGADRTYLNGFSMASVRHKGSSLAVALHGEGGDPLFDQFSLGRSIYFLVSGVDPGNPAEPLSRTAPHLPSWFSEIVMRMVAPAPEQRFASLSDMIAALSEELRNPEATEGEEILSTPRYPEKSEKPEKPEKPEIAAPNLVREREPETIEPGDSARSDEYFEEFSSSNAESDPDPDSDLAVPKSEGEEEFEEIATSMSGVAGYLLCYPHQPFLLPVDRVFAIGRDPGNDLLLASEDVSSFHARIFRREQRYVLRDLNSSNGTSLNGEPIREAFLNQGDNISIGANTLLYQEALPGKPPDETGRKLVRKKTVQMPSTRQAGKLLSSLSGDLSQISLWQVMQMLAGEEKTGALIVTVEERTEIFFLNGVVVHCESGKDKGRELIYRVVLLQKGRFEFDPTSAPREITMSDAVETLLLEAARRLDEQQR